MVFEDNFLVRVDNLLYKYNFSSDGVIKSVNNAFYYMFYKSIVSFEDVKMADLIMRYINKGIKR